jgi:outer membrane protein assembly factor BamA
MFATAGSQNRYSIEAAGHYFGGDIEYQLQELRSDWYFPLHDYLTFVAKARFNFLTNWGGNESDIPYAERFFPGGVSYDGQIRGYADRSISPRDVVFEYDSTTPPDAGGNYRLQSKSTYLTGGASLSIYALELRVPVMKDQLYLSWFNDFGNTWLDIDRMSFGDLYKSTGFGVRFVIPMLGVLGFDMAYPFDDPDSDDWKFHFQIGPEL